MSEEIQTNAQRQMPVLFPGAKQKLMAWLRSLTIESVPLCANCKTKMFRWATNRWDCETCSAKIY